MYKHATGGRIDTEEIGGVVVVVAGVRARAESFRRDVWGSTDRQKCVHTPLTLLLQTPACPFV